MKDWVKVYTASKDYEINLAKGVLAENDIESKEISQKDSSFLIGSIDLYVHEKDAAKAKEILEKSDKV